MPGMAFVRMVARAHSRRYMVWNRNARWAPIAQTVAIVSMTNHHNCRHQLRHQPSVRSRSQSNHNQRLVQHCLSSFQHYQLHFMLRRRELRKHQQRCAQCHCLRHPHMHQFCTPFIVDDQILYPWNYHRHCHRPIHQCCARIRVRLIVPTSKLTPPVMPYVTMVGQVRT